MQISRLLVCAGCAVVITTSAIVRSKESPPKIAPVNPVITNCNVTPPNTKIAPPLLKSGLPCSVAAVAPFSLDNLQHAFDYFSWLSFLALNSPVGGKTVIGHGAAPGGDAATIWESWKNISDVMLPDGATPQPWDSPHVLPPVCRALATPHIKLVSMVGKTPDLLQETVQPFDTGPLIDQHGRYVRYEILINRPMFEFLVQNRLYSKQGQAAFNNVIQFPEGAVTSGSTGTMGAIMVKAAWKVLDASDRATDFHTAESLIYTPAVPQSGIAESCVKGTLGLVGLHIAHKTKNEPQWTWSSFEHIANAPSDDDVKTGKLQARYNFYNVNCKSNACPVNTPPPRPWNPNIQPFPNGFTSQITRAIALNDATRSLNASYQGLLGNTVWRNYELVSTQWPTNAASKTDPNGVPAPVFLANTTMETYIQGRVPQTSSSCMACHGNAAATTGRTADFTYILERAR